MNSGLLALLKLRTLISVHLIGCRKTKLSMERKMFPVCGPHKYSCISVVFRHLGIFRRFSGGFRKFPEVFRKFPKVFPMEKVWAAVTMVGIELTSFGLLI
jgi:hypothetical protein